MSERPDSIIEIKLGSETLCVLMFQCREDGSLGVFGFRDIIDGKFYSVRELNRDFDGKEDHIPHGTPAIKEVSGMEAGGGALLVINRSNFEQTMVELRELLSGLLAEAKDLNIDTEVKDEIVL